MLLNKGRNTKLPKQKALPGRQSLPPTSITTGGGLPRLFVLGHLAIANVDNAMRIHGDIVFVGH